MRSEQVQWLIAVGQADATTLPELEETNKTLSAMFFFFCVIKCKQTVNPTRAHNLFSTSCEDISETQQ